MIVTDLEHASKQLPASAALEKALAFLRRGDIAALPDGRYEIDGERVFAMAQRYETAAPAEPRFETHRKYIDVQFIAAGAEVIGWAPARLMEVTEPYEEGKDICFGLVKPGRWTPVRLGAGQLAVLYPEDAHAPRLAAGRPAPAVKVVVKVAVRRRGK
jgi:YhcH/YjgK/YiaL family protein